MNLLVLDLMNNIHKAQDEAPVHLIVCCNYAWELSNATIVSLDLSVLFHVYNQMNTEVLHVE